MANISSIKLPNGDTYNIKDSISGYTTNIGTVTSVRVQATSPVQSSTNTAQSSSLNTTISLANAYGDTKNPYGTKTANYVLAGPSSGSAAAPSFRKLVAADIPDLSATYATQTDLENLPEPMIFKGSLGTGGTITSLPTAAAANEGFTYKVITAGTYASQSAKIGDTFISDGSSWVLIPSGDEPSGTVTSITLTSGTGISVSNSGTAITTSGSRTISLASITKSDTTSTASPSHGGTFTAIDSVTYDSYGRVTGVNTKTVTLPSDSNTDTKVTQAYSTTNNSYPLLFSATAGVSSTSSRGATTAIVNNAIYANPSTGNLQVTKLNSYTPAAAMEKSVDTSISAASTSANLPTSAAVASFVEGKGYITSYTDTKNTAGSTNTSSKIFLIGATSQAANPQTYSHDTAYVGTNGHLYSASKEVLVGGSNSSSSVTITPSTTSVYSITGVGSAASMTWSVNDTKLTITFSGGSAATRSQVSNLWNGYTVATAAAQIFTGATS